MGTDDSNDSKYQNLGPLVEVRRTWRDDFLTRDYTKEQRKDTRGPTRENFEIAK